MTHIESQVPQTTDPLTWLIWWSLLFVGSILLTFGFYRSMSLGATHLTTFISCQDSTAKEVSRMLATRIDDEELRYREMLRKFRFELLRSIALREGIGPGDVEEAVRRGDPVTQGDGALQAILRGQSVPPETLLQVVGRITNSG